MNNKELAELRNRNLPPGFASAKPSYATHAEGARVYDADGKEFIDFVGGIAVMNVGHSHPSVVKAIQEQAAKFTHTCFMISPYEEAVLLAETLCRLAPVKGDCRAMLVNSGAEAVENAVKIARYHTKRDSIIVFDHAFHGRTLLTMTMTAKAKPYKLGFGPYAPEIYRIPSAYCYRCPLGETYPGCGCACAELLEDMFITCPPEQTAAIIAEPVQGEGGFIVPPKEYFPKLAEICRKNDVLFVSDEIQSGMGRTGEKLFAIEHWGVQPDMVTVAKSLAAGMPLSAVVGKKAIMDSVHPGGIGGTYGGNPVCCAAANAVFEIIENENLLEKGRLLGLKVRKAFDELAGNYEAIGDVRGLGPMMALELVKDRTTKEPDPEAARQVAELAFERGLLIITCGTYGNVIRTMMPLVISDDELDRGLAILNEAFGKL